MSKIKDEVRELHPLLGVLFDRLVNIKQVLHTHGPDELGADFILVKNDSTLNTTNHIGVVVKNHTLSKDKAHAVVKQVKECFALPRYIGKTRIMISEVWVVVNGTISKKASELLHEECKVPVHFIDRSQLVGLMVKNKLDMSEDMPTSVQLCLSKQRAQAEAFRHRSFSLLAISDREIFMDQRVARLPKVLYDRHGAKRNPRRAPRLNLKPQAVDVKDMMDLTTPAVFLCGDPGSGKSMLLHKTLADYAEPRQFKKNRKIPLLVGCTDVVNIHNKQITHILDQFIEKFNLENEKCHYVLILDGLDECKLSLEDKLELIQKWRSEASADTRIDKIVISGREFWDEDTIKMPVYDIVPLSMRDVITTVKENLSHLSVVNRIISDLQRSDLFRALPQTPLATVLLINLLCEEADLHELPATLTELFSKYSEVSLGRWNTKEGAGITLKKYDATDAVLAKIAAHMVQNGVSTIREDDAKLFFNNYCRKRLLKIEPDILYDGLIERRSDIVDVTDGMFGFRHRTVMEFFYAKQMTDKQLLALREDVFSPHWHTIAFFFVGMQKDCPELLRDISAITPEKESGKVLKALNMSEILLAAYSTDKDVIKDVLKSTFLQLADYLDGVLSRKQKTKLLAKLPIMRILLIFRVLAEDRYARHFFTNAIEDSMLEIEDANIDDGAKATALFLLNLPYRVLGGEDVFDGMIQKMGDKIPLHIRLGIQHETNFSDAVSPNIKKFKRSMDKYMHKHGKRLSHISLYQEEIRFLPDGKKKK